ncbi:MAG: hypothetical protein PHE89_01455 [Alphaproteobacteria bacterium]|nr:hypothetical protein [Alphaproteobacteria bacterium]
MNEELIKIPLRDFIVELITPKQTLDMRVFDDNGIMHPKLKDKILRRSDFLVNKTIRDIKNIERTDVVLVGSSASYFYKQNSDLDVAIFAENTGCDFIAKDADNLGTFLSYLTNDFYKKYRQFSIDGQYLDMKLRSVLRDRMGVYSILNEKWVREARKDVVKDIDADDLMNKYYLNVEELDIFLNKIKYNENDVASLEECKRINEKFKDSILNIKSVEEYLIFKLMKIPLKDLNKIYQRELAKSFSLEIEL